MGENQFSSFFIIIVVVYCMECRANIRLISESHLEIQTGQVEQAGLNEVPVNTGKGGLF